MSLQSFIQPIRVLVIPLYNISYIIDNTHTYSLIHLAQLHNHKIFITYCKFYNLYTNEFKNKIKNIESKLNN
jgi:hypothetical protein